MTGTSEMRRTRVETTALFYVQLTVLVTAISALGAQALELPTIFSDHMVLQQAQPLPIWGRAEPGARVTVEFEDQSVEAMAAADGNWMVTLAPAQANAEPQTLSVQSGPNRAVFNDVLVGEVWLCSGQSNMQLRIAQSLNADLIALAGTNPLLRLYSVDRVASPTPRFSTDAAWTLSNSKTIPTFSAAGFYFGSLLQSALQVPVGLIVAAWGATPAIAWTRPAVLDRHPLLIQHVADWDEGMKKFPERFAVYREKCAEWNKAKGRPVDARVDHLTHRDAPKPPPFDPDGPQRPGSLANGMLATVAPFAMRGVVWYQGENDTNWVPEKYDERLSVMVNDWRVWWKNPSLAFGVVQLASHGDPVDAPSDDAWAELRESQRRFVRNDPHAGLAVAIDVGEANDIHPFDKETIGQRLARWALVDVYRKISLRGGPEPVDATFDREVRIRFESVGGGLWIFNGKALKGFTLAGADGVFHDADAAIDGENRVVVSSPDVLQPQVVRYAWARHPRGANLANRQRLPAAPFEMLKPSPTSE